MSALTATQKRLVEAASRAGNAGLHRIRGGYSAGLPPKEEVFTIRTVRAVERMGLIRLDGVIGETLRVTQAGRDALKVHA